MTITHTMSGTVTGFDGYFFTVECPEAPSYLQVMRLTRFETGPAVEVGDLVKLGYRATPSSGLWVVLERLSGG